MEQLVTDLLQGSRRALARFLTYVENEREGVDEALAALFPYTGRAWIVGVTGAPGTGKSSLVNVLAGRFRKRGQQVGIIAVDPTSPFTGGAILGDRIRMRDLSGDPGVFIRSMATRGSLGGLSRATRDSIRVLDAAGFDVIMVETVGAGQSEIDIVRTAQTTLVVEAPGLGDDVQAIKAGILEIADVLVVNKADRPGARQTVQSLQAMLQLGHPAARGQLVAHHGSLMPVESPAPSGNHTGLWVPPIVSTVALDGTGMDDLLAAMEKHREHLLQDAVLDALERMHIEIELYERLRDAFMNRLLRAIPPEVFADLIGRIQSRAMGPQRAVRDLLEAHVTVD